jgi:magnesium-transporting ATPase (P-type)
MERKANFIRERGISRKLLDEPHALSINDILALLSGHRSGLSTEESAARLQRDGPNRLPEAKRRSPLLRFLAHFNNVLIYVLLASAVTTGALGHVADTAVILAVVIANAIIGFIQEGRAEQAMSAIRQMLSPHTTVLRDGRRVNVDSADVVPGDVVILEAGDKVPADLRLMEAAGLRVEEAVLTGESVPVEKLIQPVAADAPLGDRDCMAYSGTLVAGGTGRGLVVATGVNTEIGKISGMLSRVETLTTPLTRQMDRFARWLTILILSVAAVLLVYGYFVGHLPFVELFMIVVGLSVAAIPEGLPAVLTITLAVGVRAMARRNAIVRRLPAIETLGSVSVICTDKTGTLTRNEMVAASIATADHVYSVSGEGYAPEGIIRLGDADVDPRGISYWLSWLGRPPFATRRPCIITPMVGRSKVTLWRAPFTRLPERSCRMGPTVSPNGRGRTPSLSMPMRATWPRFTMTTLAMPKSTRRARPSVFSPCVRVRGKRTAGKRHSTPIGGLVRSCPSPRRDNACSHWRTICASEPSHPNASDVDGKLVLLGLIGLIDPPRNEVIDAVRECRGAGIRVKMITGDHAVTAAAIARQIGLQNPDGVLTGPEIERMSAAELAIAVVDADASPEPAQSTSYAS